MVNLLRRFQQPVLIALTVLIIIAFVILYGGPGARLDRLGSDNIGRIHGRNVTSVEYRSIMRQFEVCRILGMFDVIIPLSQNAHTMQEAVDNYVWNTIVLRHEADALGIAPSENQIVDAIQHLPSFLNKGQYDHTRYEGALQNVLAPRGMGATQFEALIADAIRIQSIHDVLSASSTTAPDELLEAYRRQYQKVEAAVVRFSRDEIAKAIVVSDDDLKKAYESRKDSLKTVEKRKVDFVVFPLPSFDKSKDAAKPDPEAIQKLADKASDFAGALLEPGAKFEDVAKKFDLEVKTTGAFASGDRVEELGNQPRVSTAAFQLTAEKPNSEAVGSPKGYLVLHLKEIEASKPLSFDEAKEQLSESLKKDSTRETLSLKASEAKKKIEEAVKAGKTFAEAAAAAGVKAETLEAFSRNDSNLKGTDSSVIQNSAVDLKEGQTSAPLDAPDGTILVHLVKRLPIDPADVEKQKSNLTPMIDTQRTDGLLGEWLDRQRIAAGLSLNQN